jgi:hypothetical protein
MCRVFTDSIFDEPIYNGDDGSCEDMKNNVFYSMRQENIPIWDEFHKNMEREKTAGRLTIAQIHERTEKLIQTLTRKFWEALLTTPCQTKAGKDALFMPRSIRRAVDWFLDLPPQMQMIEYYSWTTNLSAFGDTISMLTKQLDFSGRIANSHRHVWMMFLCLWSCHIYRPKKPKINILATGEKCRSKSNVIDDMAREYSVPGVHKTITRTTKEAYNTATYCSDEMHTKNENGPEDFGMDDRGNMISTVESKKATRCTHDVAHADATNSIMPSSLTSAIMDRYNELFFGNKDRLYYSISEQIATYDRAPTKKIEETKLGFKVLHFYIMLVFKADMARIFPLAGLTSYSVRAILNRVLREVQRLGTLPPSNERTMYKMHLGSTMLSVLHGVVTVLGKETSNSRWVGESGKVMPFNLGRDPSFMSEFWKYGGVVWAEAVISCATLMAPAFTSETQQNIINYLGVIGKWPFCSGTRFRTLRNTSPGADSTIPEEDYQRIRLPVNDRKRLAIMCSKRAEGKPSYQESMQTLFMKLGSGDVTISSPQYMIDKDVDEDQAVIKQLLAKEEYKLGRVYVECTKTAVINALGGANPRPKRFMTRNRDGGFEGLKVKESDLGNGRIKYKLNYSSAELASGLKFVQRKIKDGYKVEREDEMGNILEMYRITMNAGFKYDKKTRKYWQHKVNPELPKTDVPVLIVEKDPFAPHIEVYSVAIAALNNENTNLVGRAVKNVLQHEHTKTGDYITFDPCTDHDLPADGVDQFTSGGGGGACIEYPAFLKTIRMEPNSSLKIHDENMNAIDKTIELGLYMKLGGMASKLEYAQRKDELTQKATLVDKSYDELSLQMHCERSHLDPDQVGDTSPWGVKRMIIRYKDANKAWFAQNLPYEPMHYPGEFVAIEREKQKYIKGVRENEIQVVSHSSDVLSSRSSSSLANPSSAGRPDDVMGMDMDTNSNHQEDIDLLLSIGDVGGNGNGGRKRGRDDAPGQNIPKNAQAPLKAPRLIKG